jgi:hypothetical protein
MGMEGAIVFLREEREKAGRADQPFAISGGFSYYVGEPTFDVPEWVVTGSPEKLAEQLAKVIATGVTNVLVRPPSQSCADAVEQVEAFGQRVAPLVASA